MKIRNSIVVKILRGLLIRLYNCLMTTKIINKNTPFFRRLRAVCFHNICFKCEAYFGKKNPDKIFYVIRCPQYDMGFFGVYNYIVNHMKIVDGTEMIPVVDWMYYPNSYITEDYEIGKVNAWEYYFQNYSVVSLEEVYQSQHVVMCRTDNQASLTEVYDEKELIHSNCIINKYMKLNKEVLDICNKWYSVLGMNSCKILGVKCRGTDFVSSKPTGHSICPDALATIEKIEEQEKEWGSYDKIFVATEDKNIYQDLIYKYGDRLITNGTFYFENTGDKWLSDMFEDVSGTKRDRMTEYLVSTYLLAQCDALIAPIVGGTLGAMRMKGKYEKLYLFQLGLYE